MVERAVLFCRGRQVTADELPMAMRGDEAASPRPAEGRVEPLQNAVERAEADAIRAALQSTGGRRADAAELLGISRKTLWEKIKNLDISVDF